MIFIDKYCKMKKTYKLKEEQFKKIIEIKKINKEGLEAAKKHKSLVDNPYSTDSSNSKYWIEGWLKGQEEEINAPNENDFTNNPPGPISEENPENNNETNDYEILKKPFSGFEVELDGGDGDNDINNFIILNDVDSFDIYIEDTIYQCNFDIDFDVKPNGIEKIIPKINNVKLNGVISLWGEDNDFDYDFMIEYDGNGNLKNTTLGNNEHYQIKNIPNKVKITFKNSDSKEGFLVAVREIDFKLVNNEIKIWF